jgi:hypothetical protein
MELTNRLAVITGGAGGIGAACAPADDPRQRQAASALTEALIPSL